ncbi:pyruvate kinase [Herbaspirillum sp. GCM10030257]|uniref:pyruvate kinase n=1 Tax=Herbaspirillum sp. GCM10030257 TaxID=3273393 RepID=UPI0036215A53
MTIIHIPRRARNTKIIATLGPSTSDADSIRCLFEAGADVFRLNFSHGTHADHERRYVAIRSVEQELGRPIAVLADLQGPKLRIGTFAGGRIAISTGDAFRFDLDPTPGVHARVCIPHPEIFAAVDVGQELLIDDGKMRFRIVGCSADSIDAVALNAGYLSERKGVNVPDAVLPLSPLTEKDRSDLSFALALGIDWVALSFVQRAKDITELKSIVAGRANIMAKLEKPSAIEDLAEIIAVADGIMVARGDLGVEMPPEAVPGLQKRIVRSCRRAGKPVVVATQMLESMISSPMPTRAETGDVATAVYDGVDAVMLSAESASGMYPMEAVSMMDRIIATSERDPLQREFMMVAHVDEGRTLTNAICSAIRTVAEVLPVSATIAYTTSGSTTMRVAQVRPRAPILSLTPHLGISRRLTLVWGVHSVCTEDATSIEDIVGKAQLMARRYGFTKASQPIVIAAGTPFGVSGSTNLLRIVWHDEIDAGHLPGCQDDAVALRDPYFVHE